jgi:hypothetical protein
MWMSRESGESRFSSLIFGIFFFGDFLEFTAI